MLMAMSSALAVRLVRYSSNQCSLSRIQLNTRNPAIFALSSHLKTWFRSRHIRFAQVFMNSACARHAPLSLIRRRLFSPGIGVCFLMFKVENLHHRSQRQPLVPHGVAAYLRRQLPTVQNPT